MHEQPLEPPGEAQLGAEVFSFFLNKKNFVKVDFHTVAPAMEWPEPFIRFSSVFIFSTDLTHGSLWTSGNNSLNNLS
ncbi:MAG: hypothetical protein CBE01_002235 [Planctomycetaceae bacterium TMED241]|nr:MAG: hypothetical protein CBE01_002235 [Planctomycetaceae bacterium TMED241]